MKSRKIETTFSVKYDADTGEIEDYLWDEDYNPPPMVKLEKEKDKNKLKN